MVEIWQRIAEYLQEQEACGLCFEFVGAGRSDYFNNLKPRVNEQGDCCVYLGLLRFGGRRDYRLVDTSGFQETEIKFKDYNFEVIVGIPSRLDIQFYNENPDIDVSESKYVKYIKPVIDCLGENFDLPCEPIFEGLEISEWRWDLLLNYQDLNFDGIKITGAFRKWLL